MNKDRRNQIAEVAAKLSDLEALRDEIKDALEAIRDEEQEYFDNMPEGLQQSDRGYAAEEAVNQLEEAVGVLDDFDIMGLAGNLEEAQA